MKTIFVLFSLACLTLSVARAELVLYWPLDEPAGAETVSDAVGDHSGTVGAGISFGKEGANPATGTSAEFTGSGGLQAEWAQDLNPENFTFTAWVNITDTNAYNSVVTNREDNGSTVNGFILYNNPGGAWDFWTGAGGATGAWQAIAGPVAETDVWTHLAITYDLEENVKILYVNGEEQARGEDQGYVPNGSEEEFQRPFNIGAGQDFGDGFFFNGRLDDIALFDEALTPEDIQSIMNSGVASLLGDPGIAANRTFDLDFSSAGSTITIPVRNTGESNELTISEVSVTGAQAGNFTVTDFPATVAPGTSGEVTIAFDPDGAVGAFEADLTIASNAASEPAYAIQLKGVVRDPFLEAPAEINVGEFQLNSGPHEGQIPIQNTGASQDLIFSEISFTGRNAELFSTEIPDPLAPGAQGSIALTFTPEDRFGSFTAVAELHSNDPRTPVVQVPLKVNVINPNPLVAYWPLDDPAGTSGEDSVQDVFGGFHGTPDAGITFGAEGAHANSGTSALFDGSGGIHVPYNSALNPDEFTFTAWANLSDTAGWNSVVTSREDNGATVNGYILYNTPEGQWDFWTGAGGATGAWQRNIGEDAETNTWTHLAISYEAATQTKILYVNGEESARTEGQGYVPNGTEEEFERPLNIGAGQDFGDGFFFIGNIDDVGLFATPLDGDTIRQIMDNGVLSIIGDPNLSTAALLDFGAFPGNPGVLERNLRLINTGSENELTITNFSITGENADRFSVTDLPATLAPGAFADVEVTYTPAGSATGTFRATLEIESNDENEALTRVQFRVKIENANRLLAHYKLDETEGTQMTDASGNGFHGVYQTNGGGSFELGVDALAGGTAVRLSDGGGDGAGFGEVPTELDLPSLAVGSYAFWVQLDPADIGTTTGLFGRGAETPGDPFGVALAVGEGPNTIQWISDGSESLTSDPFLTVDDTFHVLLTYADENGSDDPSADRIRLYVNGELLTEATGTPGFDVRKSGPFQIGAVAGLLGLTGVMDDFQIYQKELNADEAAFLFENPGQVLEAPGGGGDPVIPPADFRVQSITRTGNEVTLTWPSTAGAFYTIQTTADLITWNDVETEFPAGAGASVSYTDTPDVDVRFYRVVFE